MTSQQDRIHSVARNSRKFSKGQLCTAFLRLTGKNAKPSFNPVPERPWEASSPVSQGRGLTGPRSGIFKASRLQGATPLPGWVPGLHTCTNTHTSLPGGICVTAAAVSSGGKRVPRSYHGHETAWWSQWEPRTRSELSESQQVSCRSTPPPPAFKH